MGIDKDNMKPLILDLYCGAGGAAKGYDDAGFLIVGIDIHNQPRYPYQYYQGDAIEEMNNLLISGDIEMFQAIHASPPCQHYSVLSNCRPGLKDEHPDLIPSTRELLIRSGLPYVIENVAGAPLVDPVLLCGSHFNLTTDWEPWGRVALRRHRIFETNWKLPDPGPHDHSLPVIQVTGHGSNRNTHSTWGKGHAKAAKEAMGISYMRRHELTEAIPPAYTAYIGKHLKKLIDT